MAPSPKKGKSNKMIRPKDDPDISIDDGGDVSEDYRKKRDRNNQAVKRSRVKSKQKAQETLVRVTKLKNENQVLEERVKTLTKELSFLKELFLLHASSKGTSIKSADLQRILSDDSEPTPE